MRIRSYLALMVVSILCPVLIAGALVVDKIRREERESALQNLKETVRGVSLIVDREIQGSLSALRALGDSAHLATGNFEAFYKQAASLNGPHVWTFLLDETGTQIINTIVPYGTAPPSTSALERVTQVIQSQKPLIADLSVSPVTGKLLTSIYVPALAAGGKKYVVAQAFDVDHWSGASLFDEIPANWIVAVIDRQGRFIARSHMAKELLGKNARPELVAASAASQSGFIRHSTIEGIESYDAFTHSKISGWLVAVAAPTAMIDAPAHKAVIYATVAILFSILAALAVAYIFGRRLTLAINIAGAAAMSLGRGQKPSPLKQNIFEFDKHYQALINAGDLLDLERDARIVAEEERSRWLKSETDARINAEDQNVAKDQFLAMLGHELRNPLAAISGAITLLKINSTDRAKFEKCVAIIDRQNRHLSYIVDDLLDVSRLLAGKIQLETKVMNIADQVRRCVEGIRSTERASGYRINMDAESVWVDADPVRLEQVLNNLISNAIKFSAMGSTVEITVRAQGAQAIVTVRDQGTGIAADLLQRIFEPFFQGPPAANRMHAGLGIGLALVKQLLALHGGSVDVESTGPGQGSSFTFKLPAVAAPADSQTLPDASPSFAKRTLVYVEDNDDIRLAMVELLSELGYKVVGVSLGADAHAAVILNKPHVVIVDIGLPDISGYEVARILRSDPTTQSIPIIAVTGYGRTLDKDLARSAGFDAHLVKPVDVFILTKTIDALLERKHA